MSIINSQPLIGASGNQGGAYNIERSLRFRSSASAYLNRTPANAGNRRTFTWSGWVKLGLIDLNYRSLFANGNAVDSMVFWNDNTFALTNFNGTSYVVRTTQVFRDPSAWYHLVIAFDTTQATASNRIKIYVNGVQVNSFATSTYPSQNYDTGYNTATVQYLGYNEYNRYDGYMAEVNFVDGQQLTASSFGETDAATGVWIPKRYTGTYGTNGFYLDFEDTSSVAALGYDAAGSNDWTVNNVSLTSGATYDSMTDVPTLTSATAANYAVLNPVQSAGNGYTLSNGNLNWSWTGGPGSFWQRATISISSGKWYWEVTPTAVDAGPNLVVGIQTPDAASSSVTSGTIGTGYGYYADGTKLTGTTFSSYGASWTNNDVIGVAFDADAGTLTFYKNNSSQGTAFSSITGSMSPVIMSYTGGSRTTTGSVNFGQRPFAYTPPTGFVALNTFNLPTPTIGATASTQANKYFEAKLYTGTGSSRSVTGYGFSPDFVWIKERNAAADHALYDSVRGVQKQVESNNTDAETTETTGLTAFNSDGFTVGSLAQVNTNTDTYVAWAWDANGAGSTNTAGTITSTVSANTSAGFSIVTYTGTGANATVGHGLGVAPSFIIVKRRNTTGGWPVYTSVYGKDYALELQSTAAIQTISDFWNTANPTSSVFGVNGSYASINASGGTYVAYCFAEVAGYSKFGSYTGNGSTDGPFVYTGFRPKFTLIKKSNSTGNWMLLDSKRLDYNGASASKELYANLALGEGTSNGPDELSNGFKIRDNYSDINASGDTYIYMAFAESPFKYANAR